jgi:hypothetical protein
MTAACGQQTRLDRFVGKDLWKERRPEHELLRLYELSSRQEIANAMRSPGNVHEQLPTPWHVWKTSGKGQTRYVVLLGSQLITIPGGSSACIQLFDVE